MGIEDINVNPGVDERADTLIEKPDKFKEIMVGKIKDCKEQLLQAENDLRAHDYYNSGPNDGRTSLDETQKATKELEGRINFWKLRMKEMQKMLLKAGGQEELIGLADDIVDLYMAIDMIGTIKGSKVDYSPADFRSIIASVEAGDDIMKVTNKFHIRDKLIEILEKREKMKDKRMTA